MFLTAGTCGSQAPGALSAQSPVGASAGHPRMRRLVAVAGGQSLQMRRGRRERCRPRSTARTPAQGACKTIEAGSVRLDWKRCEPNGHPQRSDLARIMQEGWAQDVRGPGGGTLAGCGTPKPTTATNAVGGAVSAVRCLRPSVGHGRPCAHGLRELRDLTAQRLQRADENLRERRERLDRVG